jgi:phage terminase large subunit-like protein
LFKRQKYLSHAFAWIQNIRVVDCPFESRHTFCTVVKGKMTLTGHQNDDVTYVIASIQDALEKAMLSNAVLDESSMPTLVNVKYLGDR